MESPAFSYAFPVAAQHLFWIGILMTLLESRNEFHQRHEGYQGRDKIEDLVEFMP